MENEKILGIIQERSEERHFKIERMLFNKTALSGTMEVYEIDFSMGCLQSKISTPTVRNDIYEYLYKKYEHDDVFVSVVSIFNSKLIVVVGY